MNQRPSGYPNCRFIYLTGRRADGSIFFFVDSEPAGSKDISLPGQLYPEGSEAFRRVFDTKVTTTEGPLPDRWGVWVSVLVPVPDPLTGEILAVLGMDIDARLWNWQLGRAALPAFLLTLALVIIWVAGAVLLDRRTRLEAAAPRWLRHTEPGLVVSLGLTLSVAGSWHTYTTVSRHQAEMFGKLAEHEAGTIVERLQNVRDLQLEGLAHFYSARDHITSGEFQEFARSLTRNVSVTTWGWIPVVPASDRDRFEAAARADGLPDFKIWEPDAHGKRVRAAAREMYYPVYHVAPPERFTQLSGNESGAEPRRRAALQETMATNLTTGTDPVTITLTPETGPQKGLVIYRPVYSRDGPRRLRGFVGAAILTEYFLRAGAAPDRLPLVELALLREGAAPESLATTWPPAAPPRAGRSATRPVFAFGKVFLVTVRAGPEFGRNDPLQAGGLALLSGMLLTGTLATLVRFILRRREKLEQLVAERTAELRLSEQSYRNQFANNSAVMLLINPADGAIIDANTAAVSYYGYPRERLLAMRITDINAKSVAEIRQISDFIVQGWRNRFEFQHRLADGSIRDVAVAASSIQYGGREIVHSIIQDITEQKQAKAKLQESEERFSKAFQANPSGIIINDLATGRNIEVNGSFCRLMGYLPQEVIGRTPVELGIWADAEERSQALKPLLEGGVLRNFEMQARTKSGEPKTVLSSADVIEMNGQRCVVATIQDITEQKRVSLELEAAHHAVKERIKELQCLHAVTKLTAESRGSVDERLKAAVDLIPPGWQYPEITCACITCDGGQFATPGFRTTPWMQSADILVGGAVVGRIEVCYLEEKPSSDEGPFLKEERALLLNLATQVSTLIERQRAEAKLHQLSSIIEQAPLSVIITDLVGVMEYVNPKFCAVTGYTKEEVLGQNARMLKSGEEPPEVYRELWQTISSNRVWSGEIRNRRKHGEIYLENMVIAPLFGPDGRVTHYVALKDDISAQKRFEIETIAMLNKEREVSQMKSQFVSVASHEFRSPLAAAVGSLELLQRHAARLTEAKRGELITRIQTSLGRLTTIMDDVLQLSRADSGRVKVKLMPVDLPRLVQDIIQQAEEGDRQQHRFVFQRNGGPDTVPADTNLLNHILTNLVGNAVRYSPAGTQITVTLERGETAVTFTVADEGIGIPENEREKIFEPFVRGSNVGQIGGTGLGLNIVKRYVELLGGRIEVLPAARGTTFRVSLPLVRPENPTCN